jgi:hypothetical protein
MGLITTALRMAILRVIGVGAEKKAASQSKATLMEKFHGSE